jgi:4-hydroxybenzoate polyprenyltransferase
METHGRASSALLRQLYQPRGIRCAVDSITSRMLYHLYSVWLFTLTDLKTIVGPSTAFAILHKLGRSSFGVEMQDQTHSSSAIQILIVAGWAWINLLPFAIDNQRQKGGIEEDRYNKPWRTLPSGRMTPQQATKIMLVLYPMAIMASVYLGAHVQSLTLVALGFWYNDLRGADASWLVRNLINGCGFICYTSGALQVILQQPVLNNPILLGWLATIGCIVFSTVQTQDMYDQVGDAQRGRKTAPLVLGDGLARWTIALPLLFWSWFCPRFWSLPLAGYVGPCLLGSTIAYRTLMKRSVQEDKTTFKMWNLWLVMLYSLPMSRAWLI